MRKRIIFMKVVLLIMFMGFCTAYAQDVENILVNEGFEDGVYEWPWDFYDNTGAPAYVEVVTDDPIEGDYCIHVVVPQAGANTWDVGVVHRDIVLEQGKQYTFSAFMKTNGGEIRVFFKPEQDGGSYTAYGAEVITINAEWKEYHVTTPVMSSTVDPAAATFHVAYDPGELWIDYVRFYEGEYVPSVFGPKTSALKPSPEDGAVDVPRDTILSWVPGEFAETHNLYFGTNFDDVNDGIVDVLLSEGQDANTFDPGRLALGQIYYWRIDEVNASPDDTVFRGNIWSFTVEPFAYKIPFERITATASSSADSEPNDTVNEAGLDPDNLDLHSTDIQTMWLSDVTETGHPWIQYDFDKVYKLYQMLVWNYNGSSIFWGFGIKDVNVEYSEDSETWTQLTSVTQFEKGTSQAGYEYNNTVDFNGILVKSVRINALSSWGGAVYTQSGLSEVRFLYIPVRAREPQPEAGQDNVSVDVTLEWRAGREAGDHVVSYSTNQQAVADGNAVMATVSEAGYSPLSLDLGSAYYWRIDEVNNFEIPTTWIGDLWNFKTQEYIIVEDFESYDDTEPNRIWDVWLDGWDDDNNGSTIGYPDPDIDAGQHYVETNVVYDGDQSGPLIYNNTAPVNYSEATLDLGAPQDWTAHSAEEVILNFHGNAVTFYESDDGYIAMSGEGADIWTNHDEFRFAYMTLTGNGSMIVRLDSLEENNTNTKAGIMIRETLDSDSAMAVAAMHSNGNTALQWRTEQGEDVQDSGAGTGDRIADYPVWLKLTRQGNTITGERSFDGVNWEPVGANLNSPTTATITLPNQVYIGLFVCSHVSDKLSAATFYGVETTSSVTGDWTVAAVGDTDQAEGGNTFDPLYFALEDDGGTRHDITAPVSIAVGWGDWYTWTIPYSEFTSAGVDLTSVRKIIVGVGSTSAPMHGKGTIFIDDIGYGRPFVEP